MNLDEQIEYMERVASWTLATERQSILASLRELKNTQAERDQLRARVAELERACFEAAAILRNDLYVNRVTNALAVLDEAQLSE